MLRGTAEVLHPRMPIPDYQAVMLALLKVAADGKEHQIQDATNTLADQFRLTEEERKELLPSGVDRIFRNRIEWARTYLKKAGLIEYPKRGYLGTTERGRAKARRELSYSSYSWAFTREREDALLGTSLGKIVLFQTRRHSGRKWSCSISQIVR